MFDKALEEKFIDRMDQNHEIFTHFMNDKGFQRLVSESMREQVPLREKGRSAPAMKLIRREPNGVPVSEITRLYAE